PSAIVGAAILRQLLYRASRGAVVGIALALACMAWAVIGFWISDGANVERVGLDLVRVLEIYALAGIFGGVMFGLTAPLRSSRLGRVASGIGIGLVVGAVFAITIPIDEPLRE